MANDETGSSPKKSRKKSPVVVHEEVLETTPEVGLTPEDFIPNSNPPDNPPEHEYGGSIIDMLDDEPEDTTAEIPETGFNTPYQSFQEDSNSQGVPPIYDITTPLSQEKVDEMMDYIDHQPLQVYPPTDEDPLRGFNDSDEEDEFDTPKFKGKFDPSVLVKLGARRFDENADIKLTKSERYENMESINKIMDEQDADTMKHNAEKEAFKSVEASFKSRAKDRENDIAELRQTNRLNRVTRRVARWKIKGFDFIEKASPELLAKYKLNPETDRKVWLIFDDSGKIVERADLPFSQMQSAFEFPDTDDAPEGSTETLPEGFDNGQEEFTEEQMAKTVQTLSDTYGTPPEEHPNNDVSITYGVANYANSGHNDPYSSNDENPFPNGDNPFTTDSDDETTTDEVIEPAPESGEALAGIPDVSDHNDADFF